MHSQLQESSPELLQRNPLPLEGNFLRMKNLEELWSTAQLLVEKRSRDIEDRKVLEDFEQKTSLLECHLNDQVRSIDILNRCFLNGRDLFTNKILLYFIYILSIDKVPVFLVKHPQRTFMKVINNFYPLNFTT